MYSCSECHGIFDEPDFYEFDPSPIGISLGAGCLKQAMCPFCGSEYIDDYYEDEDEEVIWLD